MRHGTSRAPAVSRRGRNLLLAALTLASFLIPGAGCASPKTELTVTALESRQAYNPAFRQAYSRRNDQGDVEVVAACDIRTASGAPHPDLKQLMHIRVLWSPGPGLKTDQPAATNASIAWYIYSDANTSNMVEYTGTGLVDVERDGNVTTVEIRKASLRPGLTTGALRDPIGPARCEGTIVARTNNRKVEEILSTVKPTLAAARLGQARTDVQGP